MIVEHEQMELNLEYQVPVYGMTDLPIAIQFFEALGYRNDWKYGDPPFYAGMYAGEESEHVVHLSLKPVVTESALYLQVSDVDAFHAECVEKGLTIVRLPEDQPYGMREMEISGPDGLRVMVATERESANDLPGFSIA